MGSNIFLSRVWGYTGLCFFLMKKGVALKLAIWLANLKQQAFNRRFFVILGPDDRLMTVCNRDIKYFRKKGYLPKSFTSLDLLEKAFYYTAASRNNLNELSVEQRRKRRQIYLAYVRMKRKF